MSYLDTKPSYEHISGGTYTRFETLFALDRNYANGLDGWSQLGSLDAVDVIAAGGMTSTGLGAPFPMRVMREP